MTKSGEIISTEVKKDPVEKPITSQHPEINTYIHGDGLTAIEYQGSSSTNSDVLFGMSELKGEMRRETEQMNAKMGVVEAQMRLVLKMLRRNNKIKLDPEIGLKLDELMEYDGDSPHNDDGEEFEWFVADSHGWKEQPPTTGEGSHNSNQLKSKMVMSRPAQTPPSSNKPTASNKSTTNAVPKRVDSTKLVAHTVVNIKKSPKEKPVTTNTIKVKAPTSNAVPKTKTSSIRENPRLVNQGYENEETIETIHL